MPLHWQAMLGAVSAPSGAIDRTVATPMDKLVITARMNKMSLRFMTNLRVGKEDKDTIVQNSLIMPGFERKNNGELPYLWPAKTLPVGEIKRWLPG